MRHVQGSEYSQEARALIDSVIREGHKDHTQSVLRYRALQQAVARFCPPDIYRDVMSFARECEDELANVNRTG